MAASNVSPPASTLTQDVRDRFADMVEAIAARQDRAAFRALFDYYAPRLKGYVLRLGAGDAQAEEIAQDVMLTVWRKAEQFDRRQASVSTWIFRIARNRRIDVARRLSKPDLDPEEPLLAPSAEPAPDDALNAQDLEERVRVVLQELPKEQLTLLQLAFYEGLSHREIAERAGLPLGTVKSRIRLAFAKMRAQLDDAAD